MWLCTKLGFFSIVQKDADIFHIRARCREDLEQLSTAAGIGTPVSSFPGSDYQWRILCPAADLPRFMQAIIASVDYGNFKNAIAADSLQRKKLASYHSIHHEMVQWQQEQG